MEEKKGSNNLKKAKELIIQNKKKAILILIAIIAIATIAVFFMQSSNKMIINLGLNNKFKVDLTETTDVTVTSKFLNGGAYETPRVIGFQLKRESGELERDIYWTAPSTNTSYTFYGVPKYDENGKEIKYTVEQVVSSFDEEVMRPYITVINGTVITNTIKGNVTLTSKWVDSEAQKENRPSSVRMQLKNDKNTVFATKELPITTDKDEFTVTFEDVPLYDNDNQLINYTVDEEGTIPFYRKSVSGTVITNTFGTETVSVDANIQWDDYNNKYGRRPDGVTLSLKIGNKVVTYHTVSNEEGWKYKFEGLDKYNSDGQEIVYSVEAYAPYEGLLYYYENPDIVDARDMGEAGKQEATINIRVDELKLSEIPAVVKVKYIDQNTGREIQDTVTIEGHIGDPYSTTELTTDDYIKITSEGNTAGKMTELQTEVTYYYAKKTKIEGKNIDKETNEILPGGYIIEGWEGKEGFFDTFDRPEEIEGYKFVEKVGRPISPMPREETQVIYYYIKTTTDIIVNKVWNDNEIQAQRRPDSIIVVVKNGDKVIVEQEVTKENVVEGTGNQWSTVIKNLPRFNEEGNEITYTIEERAKNADDLKFYTSEVTEVADNQATIRSTFKKPEDKTSVTLTKTWVDNNNEAGKRPALIRFQVKEGNEVKTHIDTAVANDMGWVFDDLPKYNDNGEQIQYTVDEAEINPGDLKFYTKTIDGGRNITNTYTVPDENISVTVTKVWEDNEIQAQRRPTSVI